MSRDVLIVGAGPGFAASTARRFGTAGWRVHLVARSRERLDAMVGSLTDDDIYARGYVGDVTRHADLTDLVRTIDDESSIDACVFQPRGGEPVVDVLDATVDNLRPHVEMLILGAVALAGGLVPGMVARASGSLVFVGGGSARLPLPVFGNLGPAMAGLRNYALTLNAALSAKGVHAAFYTAAGAIGIEDAVQPGELDPQQLAERMYALVRDRDAAEVLMTPNGEVIPKGSR